MQRMGLLLAILLLSCQGGAATETDFNVSDHEGKVVVLDFWGTW